MHLAERLRERVAQEFGAGHFAHIKNETAEHWHRLAVSHF